MLSAAVGHPLLACAACARPTLPTVALLIAAMMAAPLLAVALGAWAIRAERRR